jgi:hypothetical protein
MSRAEMDELGWDSCDIIIVTGDAYIDHPSFGMALVGRLLENQGFRVGIIAQPDWQDPEAFRTLGQPNLFFGVTAGNMDSMINRYTADKKPRSDDAYTPHAAANKRPDRAVSQYAQRCRQAFPGVGVMIGSIEASLRRIAHFDYWSENVRPSVLISSKADILLYGNAERALVEIAHRVAAGEKLNQIRDVRGTAFLANHGWLPDASWQTQEETTVPDVIAAAPVRGAVSFAPATNPYQMKDKSANMLHPTCRFQTAPRLKLKPFRSTKLAAWCVTKTAPSNATKNNRPHARAKPKPWCACLRLTWCNTTLFCTPTPAACCTWSPTPATRALWCNSMANAMFGSIRRPFPWKWPKWITCLICLTPAIHTPVTAMRTFLLGK